MELQSLQRGLQVAQGRAEPDLVLKNARIINVFTGEVEEADVALADGRIAGVGRYAGPAHDLEGRYLCPGLIDGHIHLESTMLIPPQFAKAAVPRGTTAIVADPHEIANVLGTRGLDYLLAASQGLPLDFFFMVPSCVPATHLETAGADLPAAVLTAYRGQAQVLGLAEMMNFPGVLAGNNEVLEKLLTFQNFPVDGHAPLLSGPGLNAYRFAGIGSDHECTTLDEGREKLARGFYLMIREGSQAKNLETLLPAVTPHTLRRCLLVTDDCHPHDLLQHGHLDQVVRLAVAAGLDPVSAIIMTSLNPAEYFRLPGRGAVAPGYWADLAVLDDLANFHVSQVYKRGQLVAENGICLPGLDRLALSPPTAPLQVRPLSRETFAIPAQGEVVKIIGVVPGQLLTTKLIQPVPRKNGFVVADPGRDVVKLAVVERHRGTGQVGLGLVHGFGLQNGALASSVAHDSHNLMVVGVNDDDMLVAAQRVVELGGGLVVAAGGRILAELPLPVGGLMSLAPVETVAAGHKQVTAASRALGCQLPEPFMTLAFLALPVIPALKLTDRGLVDVNRFALVPLFGEA